MRIAEFIVRDPSRLEEPIRSEVFGLGRLAEHGRSLAAAQGTDEGLGRGKRLLPRVRENGRLLLSAYRTTSQSVRENNQITSAEEWLLDNFHVVEEQLRDIHDHLPRSYYRLLPKIQSGHLEGYPRVYGLAWAYVAHTDSRFEIETLDRFIRAFQEVRPLTIGELWAVAIHLRVALVENLRRLSQLILGARMDRAKADQLADQLLGLTGEPLGQTDHILSRLSKKPLSRPFAVQVLQRLRDQDPSIQPALRWLDLKLKEQGTNATEMVAQEHRTQAEANVTVRNIVTSMRWMVSIDWEKFFEELSLVDRVLSQSPGFAAMDFETRNEYRTQIELLARRSGRSELGVARETLEMARRSTSKGDSEDTRREGRRKEAPNQAISPDTAVLSPPSDKQEIRDGHPEHRYRFPNLPESAPEDLGYYLLSKGRVAFEQYLGVRVPWRVRLYRAYRAYRTVGFLGAISASTGLVLAVALLLTWPTGGSAGILALLGVLAVVPASEIAVHLVYRLVAVFVSPSVLPKLSLDEGVPPELRTIVVVPTLLSNRSEVEEQLERLEVHYLANPEGHLHFALLSDYTDAPREHMDGDGEILNALTRGIANLNQHYPGPPGAGERFYLLHRRRLWNPGEGCWMGWERKRGKLHELNRLLRGATDTTFVAAEGSTPQGPTDVRYVITLDVDTRLPKAAAYRLIGAIAHPLNRPRFDPVKQRIVDGYAILQPRITPSLPTGPNSTPYQRIISGPGGVDPYAAAVSDVYQDLFEEGSYTGKGIYDVDAFESALEGRVPENTLLSHDLFEGIFSRAGLVTDIELFEEFPNNYEVAARRQHRWARGDWQLLPWILGQARDAAGNRQPMDIPPQSRWKMVDNLRRTLMAPSSFLLAVVAWTLGPIPALLWSSLVIGPFAVAAFIPVLDGLIPRRRGVSKRSHLRAIGNDVRTALTQTLLAVTMLAHQAWLMADAIVRTLWRLYGSRRNLLEWQTTAQSEYGIHLNLGSFYWHLRWGLLLALGASLAPFLFFPTNWPVATPFILLWILAPLFAERISLPLRNQRPEALSPQETQSLRLIARRTWLFFETFVGEEENFLPPDNFQEDPEPVVAHRTSPTNLGAYLLSALAAHDFGWMGTHDLVGKIEATLGTMTSLPRLRGHFYNWYDTRTLEPLEPRYISTVDSGNLAGHLIVLSQACRDSMHRPFLDPQALQGIRDNLNLVIEAVRKVEQPPPTQTVTAIQLVEETETMLVSLEDQPTSLSEWVAKIHQLKLHSENLLDIARTLSAEAGEESPPEILVWAEAVATCIQSHARDVEIILPWCGELWGTRAPESATAQADGFSADSQQIQSMLDIPLEPDPTLADLRELVGATSEIIRTGVTPTEPEEKERLLHQLEQSATALAQLEHRLAALGLEAERMFQTMEFRFLFDPSRKLFSIGYREEMAELDPSCYDLLASEARLASFVAIAKGDVSPRHWFRLGRALTPLGRGAALVSWSGSMFEYLMPLLVMRQPARSLLDLTCRLVVKRQILYGKERKIPWGVSESAYNVRDLDQNYQYSAFGVPGLGLKRGLFQAVVTAPYATALAAMIDPRSALNNFGQLEQVGALGRYGFYEALDYTPSRLPENLDMALVRTYMSHHQGMTVVSLANVVHDAQMQSRFHAHPIVKTAELLLQERTPRAVSVSRPRVEEVKQAARIRELVPPTLRKFESPHDITPRTHLLSNGRYTVMVTAAGCGFSSWNELAVTRWREDATRDPWGSFIFLRDRDSGQLWSAGFQPSGNPVEDYEVVYSEDRAKIIQHDRSLSITLEIVVSPEDDGELRRLTVTNLEDEHRKIDFTSYAEVVLAPEGADGAHPAFSKLFLETEFNEEFEALLTTRRPRSPEDPRAWLAHLVTVDGNVTGPLEYETDRARFLGRGRDLRTARSIQQGVSLSNTTGRVLDPILSLRRGVDLGPGEAATLIFITFVAPTREGILKTLEKYRQPATFDRESSLAWTHAQVQLHHLQISQDEAHLFQRLANRILYLDPTLRAIPRSVAKNRWGPSRLWPHGISGDLPIALAYIEREEELPVIRQLLRAHEYWLLKGVAADLVIINAQGTSYVQALQDALQALTQSIQSTVGDERHRQQGGVFVLKSDQLSSQEHTLLQAAARLIVQARDGSLAEQVVRLGRSRPGPVPAPRRRATQPSEPSSIAPEKLQFFNGLGGFSKDGREYVIVLGKGQRTPAPWINVVANPYFGFQVSESGAGFTWSGNSRLNRLTPWSNDPVSDTPGETFYVQDEEEGFVWSPTALPIREENSPYLIRHGAGYSRFQNTSHGIALDLLQFVPIEDPVKISRLRLENQSGHRRKLSVTAYVEWVLGVERGSSSAFVVTGIDSATGAMLAKNAWNEEFPGRVAFADLSGLQTSWTGDRLEFLGRNSNLDQPRLSGWGKGLSGRTGAGLDPCAALQTQLELDPGERTEIVFLLGQGADSSEAQDLVKRYRKLDAETLLQEVVDHWDRILGAVEVSTPEPSMNLLLNRWLIYQTLSCRLWSRSAFYQSGGAFGFRDQLQDAMALAVTRPDLLRDQLLRSAARQFPEGDVQHWWHPPSGRGVRTRISDDRLWLPYALIHYLQVTEDWALLEEEVSWLKGRTLEEGEQEAYFVPEETGEKASLYEHAARALERSLELGPHGLPLMGAGDWNDGMNRVGYEGRGESVWLGWFLLLNLREFARLAELRGEKETAHRWRQKADQIKAALETEGWDGEWYRRAFFDDGTPLGSSQNQECRIDSLPQSWATLSGEAIPDRARQAMDSVVKQLVRPDEKMILLFTPPFDQTPLDPGYIKGYPPGVRENGGQYTHAAVWAAIALARLGEGDQSVDLFKLINPINHSSRRADVQRYKVEPYVVAADVYSEPSQLGRGGWTWYTGAAGWLYRAGLESILGFQKRGSSLLIDPCIPKSWKGFELRYRNGSSRYYIRVRNVGGVCRGVSNILLDGRRLPPGDPIPLSDDGQEHQVQVELG